jgi:hypothetical protein
MIFTRSKCKFPIPGQLSKNINVKRGLRQAHTSSSIMFNTALEKVTTNIGIDPNGSISNRIKQYIADVDDMVMKHF